MDFQSQSTLGYVRKTEFLQLKPNDCIVDGTLGLGGHALSLIKGYCARA